MFLYLVIESVDLNIWDLNWKTAKVRVIDEWVIIGIMKKVYFMNRFREGRELNETGKKHRNRGDLQIRGARWQTTLSCTKMVEEDKPE